MSDYTSLVSQDKKTINFLGQDKRIPRQIIGIEIEIPQDRCSINNNFHI
jgi:hypothetical protein